MLLLISCEEGEKKNAIYTQIQISTETTASLLQDSSELADQWLKCNKIFEGLSSEEAYSLVTTNLTLSEAMMRQNHSDLIVFTKTDLGGSKVQEILVRLLGNQSLVFQIDPKMNHYRCIWIKYHDDGGTARINNLGFIETTSHYPCSNCALTTQTFYKVYQDSVREILNIATSYSYDNEITQNDFLLNESCNAHYCIRDSLIEVQFALQFSEVSSSTVFAKENILAIYRWNESSKSYKLHSTNPESFLKLIERNKTTTTTENKAIFSAWFETKKEELVRLKLTPKYSKIIERIEQGYSTPWQELILTWNTNHSSGS